MSESPSREHEYSDEEAAALYEAAYPWGASDAFYLGLVMAAPSVLDVGCGTGALLRRARERGHEGRLCGLDPDRAALRIARTRTDVEWVEGVAAAMRWAAEFDLAVMTGHAFQCLLTDDEVQASLAAIRRALARGGLFAFETRNPLAREWETWPDRILDVVDPSGRRVRVSYDVESVAEDVVTIAEVTSEADGGPLRVDRASLRFLAADALDGFLVGAGFAIEDRYGEWDASPFAPGSPEIVTLARAAG
jgi:SAM-dependent methyltransferase